MRSVHLKLRQIDPDTRTLLEQTAKRIAIAANHYVTIWHQWHRELNSGEALENWLASLREWHREGHPPRPRCPMKLDKDQRKRISGWNAEEDMCPLDVTEEQEHSLREWKGQLAVWTAEHGKPLCPVVFATKELEQTLYRELSTKHWRTNAKVLASLMNWIRSKMTTSSSGLAEWHQILLNRRRSPQFIDAVPIPLHNSTTRVTIGEEVDERGKTIPVLQLSCRIDRVPVSGRKNATSHEMTFALRAGGKVRSYADDIWKMAEAGGKVTGVKLLHLARKRQWQAVFSVEDEPAERTGDPGRVAVVCAGKHFPFSVRVTGRTYRHGHSGEHIGHLRSKLLRQRLSRQNAYRISASSARRGGGRKRAIASWEGRLSLRWKSLVKDSNHHWSKALAHRLWLWGVGRVIFIQPTGGDRFLETTGQVAGYESSSGWDWTQWMARASEKCARKGIVVECVKDSRARRKFQNTSRQDVA